MLLALFACASGPPPQPDVDALLRAHDLVAAAQAFEAEYGKPLDLSHPAADALVRRMATEPGITAEQIAETMRAVRLVESAPDTRTQELDIPFDHLLDYASCTASLLSASAAKNSDRSDTWLVAVGRSELPVDADPFIGGPTPFHGGRVVGWAGDLPTLAALFAAIDKDPPPRKVTLSMHGASDLHVFLTHRNGAWWSVSASDAAAGAHWITTCLVTPH